MFKLGCLFAIILSGLAYGGNLPLPFRVVPQPKQVELLSGSGIKCTDLKSVEVRGTDKSIIMGPILSALPHTGPEDGQVSLEIASDNEEPNSEEGYLLIISKGKARIKSKGLAGLFYGCQTLEQMLQDSHDTGASLPACKIIDFPSYPYRAVQFDVKHHLDSIKYYYDCIDKLAQYKVNAIIFEFEDKLRYRRQPVVGSPQAMSMDEMAAMTRYAKERFIDISPLVQGLGHASYILKHEQYSYLREEPNSNWTFCPLQEDTYKVLFDLYRDAMEATPESRYLHIGGDEIGNIGKCPRCNQRCKDTGPLKLNLYWLNRVCEFVRQNGRIPILWDDMILKHADLYWTTCRDGLDAQDVNNAWAKGRPVLNSSINIFPKSSIYMRWNYSLANQQGNILALQWYCQQNLSIFIATAAQKTGIHLGITGNDGYLNPEPEISRAGTYWLVALKNGYTPAVSKIVVVGPVTITPIPSPTTTVTSIITVTPIISTTRPVTGVSPAASVVNAPPIPAVPAVKK